jgi:hypothetical protein
MAGAVKHEQYCRAVDGDGTAQFGDDVLYCVSETQKIMEHLEENYPGKSILSVGEFQVDLTPLGISSGREGNRVDRAFIVPGLEIVAIDAKFGAMYTDHPEYNWQLKTYLWGLWNMYGGETMRAVILQPALQETARRREATVTSEDMSMAGEEIKLIVGAANAPDAELIRGAHCTELFCSARAVCPLWKNEFLSIPKNTHPAVYLARISPKERSDLYENLLAAQKWCSDAKAAIEAFGLEGNEFERHEIGVGRSVRVWANEVEAMAAIRELLINSGKNPDDAINPASLKGITEIEKIIGKSKAAVELMNSLTTKAEGKPALVRRKQ